MCHLLDDFVQDSRYKIATETCGLCSSKFVTEHESLKISFISGRKFDDNCTKADVTVKERFCPVKTLDLFLLNAFFSNRWRRCFTKSRSHEYKNVKFLTAVSKLYLHIFQHLFVFKLSDRCEGGPNLAHCNIVTGGLC